MEKIKEAITHVSVKSHANGAMNPKAHVRNTITEEQVTTESIIEKTCLT